MNEDLKRYIANIQPDDVTRSFSSARLDDEELIARIRAHAAMVYEHHDDNDRILRAFFSREPKTLTREEMEEVKEFADALFGLDYSISYEAYRYLYRVAEAQQNTDYMIVALHNMGSSLTYLDKRGLDHYSFSDFSERYKAYFGGAASYYKQFDQIESPVTKGYILRAMLRRYKAAPSYLTPEERMGPARYYSVFKVTMRFVNEVLSICENPVNRAKDPRVDWDRYVFTCHKAVTQMLQFLEPDFLNPKQYDEVSAAVLSSAEYMLRAEEARAKKDGSQVSYDTLFRYHFACFKAGKLDAEAFMARVFEMYDQAKPDDFSQNGLFLNTYVPTLISYAFGKLNSTAAARYMPRMRRMHETLRAYLIRIPNNLFVSDLSFNLNAIMTVLAPTQAVDSQMIMNYILASHAPTYIHSRMVVALTMEMFRRLIETDPESLVGALGVATVEELRSHADLLTEAVGRCALYHDIGKCMIIDPISNYNRSLTGQEFEIVRHHPTYGRELLRALGTDADCEMVALYHHRSYDGTFGYPAGLGEPPKRDKAVIDIATVADSLDAGTDDIGRCFAQTKTVDTLISELRSQRGTRYAPYVVRIFDDPDYCERMRVWIAKTRRAIYCETYGAASREVV